MCKEITIHLSKKWQPSFEQDLEFHVPLDLLLNALADAGIEPEPSLLCFEGVRLVLETAECAN